MLAVVVNNVFAIEHVLPVAQHTEAPENRATVPQPKQVPIRAMAAEVTPASLDSAEAEQPYGHRHKAKAAQTQGAPPKSVPAPATAPTNQQEEAHDTHSEAHVQHCHISPSTCSDQPMPPGPNMTWQVVELKKLDIPSIVASEQTVAQLPGYIAAVPTEPPRSV